ncbi:MAG TPA: hypothetical protein VF779_05835 [Pyrinomonadaceae bacterium]
MENLEARSRLVSIIGYIHLAYLGLLPALATFALLFRYGHPFPFLLFLGGTAAVGVYLAVTFSYTPQPTSLGFGLLILLDGPLWVLLSLLQTRVNPLGFAVEGFLVDGTAIWISILVLSIQTYIPLRQDRFTAIGFMLAALAATISLAWPYLRDELWRHWASMALIVAGIVESTLLRFSALSKQQAVHKDENKGAGYIIVMLLLWFAAMVLGNVLHEYLSK